VQSNKNTITINGKVYNATTGALIRGDKNLAATKEASPANTTPPVRSTSIASHSVRASAIHKRQHHAKTLMRSVVKAPERAKMKKASSGKILDVTVPHQFAIRKDRVERAQHTAKSRYVSRFGNDTTLVVVKKQAPLLVKKSPDIKKPVPSRPIQHTQKSDKDVLLEAALLKSKSHEQPRHHIEKKRQKVARKFHLSKRLVNVAAAMAVIVLIVGFFSYQNMPRLAMHLAAKRSGINASLPSYQPSGFAMKGNIIYSPGRVSVSFGNPNNQAYVLTERATNWDTDRLQASLASNTQRTYQTYLQNGKTIFVYNDTNATWIKNDILYSIEATANLDVGQLIKVAASF
jgi:hypothetical protein